MALAITDNLLDNRCCNTSCDTRPRKYAELCTYNACESLYKLQDRWRHVHSQILRLGFFTSSAVGSAIAGERHPGLRHFSCIKGGQIQANSPLWFSFRSPQSSCLVSLGVVLGPSPRRRLRRLRRRRPSSRARQAILSANAAPNTNADKLQHHHALVDPLPPPQELDPSDQNDLPPAAHTRLLWDPCIACITLCGRGLACPDIGGKSTLNDLVLRRLRLMNDGDMLSQ